jgi:hypothetical protein
MTLPIRPARFSLSRKSCLGGITAFGFPQLRKLVADRILGLAVRLNGSSPPFEDTNGQASGLLATLQ